jgi:putative transcription factor
VVAGDCVDCEICGGQAVYEAVVEGARLAVCEKCAKFGKIIKSLEEPAGGVDVGEKTLVKRQRPALAEEDLVDDFASMIKSAREKTGVSRTDFAKRLAVKESELEKIESGRLKPDMKIVGKLERALGIKLLE